MDKLTIARAVATNPHMVKLTQRRSSLYNRMRADYGRDFMGLEFTELPTDESERTKLQTEEMERGQEGVNRWTLKEREEYLKIESRITALRTALRTAYAQTA